MGCMLILIIDFPGGADDGELGEALVLGGAKAHVFPQRKYRLRQCRTVHPHTNRSA